MANSKNKTAKRKTSIGNDRYGKDHERLLLEAHKYLPGLITNELHSTAKLNDELTKIAPERRMNIEQMITEYNIPTKRASIWRAIPDIQFANIEGYQTEIELGVTLYRHMDKKGHRINPEALCIVDFVIEVNIPKWSIGKLKKPNPNKPIVNPVDGLRCAGLMSMKRVQVLGIIIPVTMTLGSALLEIEHLCEAAVIDGVYSGLSRQGLLALCITSRVELYEVLREKLDVMLVDGDELICDFGHILDRVEFVDIFWGDDEDDDTDLPEFKSRRITLDNV